MDRNNRAGAVIIMVLMLPSMAAAGYTDMLHAVDGNVSDCGDWSGISNSRDTSLHSYFYWFNRGDMNQVVMNDPATWGLPSDIHLCSAGWGSGDISWAYVYVRGFKHTMIGMDGLVYTDDPSDVDYITGYCKYDPFCTVYRHTYDVYDKRAVSATNGSCIVRNTITFKWASEDAAGASKTKLSEETEYAEWGVVDPDVTVQVTNGSRVNMLRVCVPANITGIKISTDGGYYEKHDYYLQKNISADGFQRLTLKQHAFETHDGLAPVGRNLLTSREPIQNVEIRLYTPFEVVNATVHVMQHDEQKESKHETSDVMIYIVIFGVITIWITRGIIK